MCEQCSQLRALAALTLEEEKLITEQVAARVLPLAAVRTLYAHEAAAQVRFADIEDGLDDIVTQVALMVTSAHEALQAALVDHLFDGVDVQDTAALVEALSMLSMTELAGVTTILDGLAGQLAEVYQGAYQWAGNTVSEEAARQGVKHDKTPGALPLDKAQNLARAAGLRSWQWVIHKTQEQLGQPTRMLADQITRTEVENIVETIKPAGAIDQARQGVHAVTGTGRIDMAEQLEPQEIYASELLDGQTCQNCEHVDGKQYETMAEALDDYPRGYYKNCSGEARCRGTLVFIFHE